MSRTSISLILIPVHVLTANISPTLFLLVLNLMFTYLHNDLALKSPVVDSETGLLR